MNDICDLHTHSVFSDGTDTPTQLIGEAERLGLSAIALTDHNTIGGLPEFLAAGENRQVKAIAGIEFSTEYQDIELHILALGVQPQYFDSITALMEDFRRRKEESNLALVEALNKAGYSLDYQRIRETHIGYVNRAHIAAELTQKGYTGSIQEAFRMLLSPGGGYYVPPKRLSSFEAIQFIKSIGAVSVLAHPFLNLTEPELRFFLPQAVESGLDAMETRYSRYDARTTVMADSIADEFGLKHSGGSDYHGGNKPDIRLAAGEGNLRVPASYARMMQLL